MSWFSRSFSMREEERGLGGDDEEEDEEEEEERNDSLNFTAIASATGLSVKEDLSNLRKTVSRQLWGVASFLAPPPPESSAVAETGGEHGGLREVTVYGQGNDGEFQSSSDAVESESENGHRFVKENVGHTESNFFAVGGGASGGTFLPEESDPQGTAASPNAVGQNALPGTTLGSDRPRLTGLRSDFEELRGTMASGFSRLSSVIRVVAGEDDSRGEENEERLPAVSARDSPGDDDRLVNLNSPRLGLDSFLKPLLGNLLSPERSSNEPSIKGNVQTEEDEGAEKYVDARNSPRKGEFGYRELNSLPSAIVSGIDGISKFASTFLHIVRDDEGEDKDDELEDQDRAVGLTEAVITFATNIAMHPETWVDFPLKDDDADDDFKLTYAQKEHVNALEIAAPGLQALKIELCPNYMTEERFWKIYFVLMHSRLSSHEARMLSTKQVVKARESMLQELQKREPLPEELGASQDDLMNEKDRADAVEAPQNGKHSENELGSNFLAQPASSLTTVNRAASLFFEDRRLGRDVTEPSKSISGSKEVTEAVEAKSEPDRGRFSMLNLEDDETEVDEWVDEEPSIKQHEGSSVAHSHMDSEDVSFSDFEEDLSSDKAACTVDTITSSSSKRSGSTTHGSAPTMPLVAGEGLSPPSQGDGASRKSSEFNDWLTVDQDDVTSAGSSSP